MTFNSEAEIILYGLCTIRGYTSGQALSFIQLWNDNRIRVYWNLDIDDLVIDMTPRWKEIVERIQSHVIH